MVSYDQLEIHGREESHQTSAGSLRAFEIKPAKIL
jgi:hypothetical protein